MLRELRKMEKYCGDSRSKTAGSRLAIGGKTARIYGQPA